MVLVFGSVSVPAQFIIINYQSENVHLVILINSSVHIQAASTVPDGAEQVELSAAGGDEWLPGRKGEEEEEIWDEWVRRLKSSQWLDFNYTLISSMFFGGFSLSWFLNWHSDQIVTQPISSEIAFFWCHKRQNRTCWLHPQKFLQSFEKSGKASVLEASCKLRAKKELLFESLHELVMQSCFGRLRIQIFENEKEWSRK